MRAGSRSRIQITYERRRARRARQRQGGQFVRGEHAGETRAQLFVSSGQMEQLLFVHGLNVHLTRFVDFHLVVKNAPAEAGQGLGRLRRKLDRDAQETLIVEILGHVLAARRQIGLQIEAEYRLGER